jgi:hypothetical protein
VTRPKADTPDEYARAVAAEIRREMGEHKMSGRQLARVLDRSEKYVRERIAGTFEWSLNDVETFALHVGLTPDVIFVRAEDRIDRGGEVIPFPVGRATETHDDEVALGAVAKRDVIDPEADEHEERDETHDDTDDERL